MFFLNPGIFSSSFNLIKKKVRENSVDFSLTLTINNMKYYRLPPPLLDAPLL